MRGLVIGADAVFAHPVQNGCADAFGTVRLDAAVCDRNDRVRFSGEKARGRLSVLLLHGELHLVPIAVGLLCAGDGREASVWPPMRVRQLWTCVRLSSSSCA